MNGDNCLIGIMGTESILSVKRSVSIDTMLNFDRDGDRNGDGNGDGTCKQTLKLQAELEERKKNRYFFKNPFHQINIRASDLTSSLKE